MKRYENRTSSERANQLVVTPRRASVMRLLFGLCLALAATALPAQVALPEMRATDILVLPDPTAGTTPTAGFTSTVKIESDLTPGYVAVNVDLQSTGGAMPGQRDLRIQVAPVNQHFPAGNAIAAEFAIPFPQGQRQIQYSFSMPKWTVGHDYRIRLFEDGSPIPGYEAQLAHRTLKVDSRSRTSMLMDAYWSNYLFLSGLPNLNRPSVPFGRNLASGSELGEFESASLAQLPRDWRLLRHHDFLVVDEDQLSDESYEKASHTITDWVMVGGVLIVEQASTKRVLQERLGMDLLDPDAESVGLEKYVSQASAGVEPVEQYLTDWIKGIKRYYERQAQTGTPSQGAALGLAAVAGGTNGVRLPSEKELVEIERWADGLDEMKQRFSQRWKRASYYHAGAGLVIALKQDELSSELDFKLLYQFLDLYRSQTVRRGVDPLLGDLRQRRWLIPGVAQPPVYTFMGILTLFVVLVGPLAYRWTSKNERLHLMFLIAPLLAGLTTIAMFTYSIISDGFDTKIRVRQITWIDGASGKAAERIRVTLFAGSSPREGLVFPATAEVMPYPNMSSFDWRDLPQQVDDLRLSVAIEESSQRFNRAVLPSRAQRQFVTHHTRSEMGGVRLSGLPTAPPNWPMVNKPMRPNSREGSPFESIESMDQSVFVVLQSSLPFDLKRVIARSEDGRYWIASELSGGQENNAVWMQDETRASSALGELYNLHRPLGSVTTARRSGRRSQADLLVDLCRKINRNIAPITEGVFETDLVDKLSVTGDLLPGTFVGLSAPSEDSIPVEGAEVVESVRYVWGSFRE